MVLVPALFLLIRSLIVYRTALYVSNWPSSTGKFTVRNCVGGIDSSG
jgi:hypothetical protein